MATTFRRFRAGRYDALVNGVAVGYFTSYGNGAFKLFLNDGTLVGIIERATRQEAADKIAQAAA